MPRVSAFKMIKRRARKAGLPVEICPHSFRGTGITEHLRNGGDLEVAAQIAVMSPPAPRSSTIACARRSSGSISRARTAAEAVGGEFQ